MAAKTLQLKVAGICGIPAKTILLAKKNREALAIEVEGLVVIHCDDQDTTIVRRVVKAQHHPLMNDFVFLSPEDLHLLNVNIEDRVELRPDTEGIECP